MRRKRTIYHNDARHYYLWVFDSPIAMEDAWRPVDEVVGTAVDTFSYCVERGDGAFYPTKVGMRFGSDRRPFTAAIYWHAWESMQSLMDRGLDPLKVLIDRAHEKGMDFFADLRLAIYGGMDPAYNLWENAQGPGSAEPVVRDHQFAVLRGLAEDYAVDGLELDYSSPHHSSSSSAAFAGDNYYFRPEDIESHTPVMTDWVRKVSEMGRGRRGKPAEIGARVFPTEEMNLAQGLDVRTWLREGLLDFVVPSLYSYINLDPNMPIDWLIEAAHEADVSIYGMLQHSVTDVSTWRQDRTIKVQTYPTPEIFRAACATYWDRGVDGLYTGLMKWPLGEAQRSMLSEMGDPDLVKEGNKRYVVARRSADAARMGYDQSLPIEIGWNDLGKTFSVPFHIADDIQGAPGRIRQVHLRINISNVVTQDQFTMLLNGESLVGETCLRHIGRLDAARDQWLEFHLEKVRPRKGKNVLEISLNSRPQGLEGGVKIEQVEVYVEYGPHPGGLNQGPSLV